MEAGLGPVITEQVAEWYEREDIDYREPWYTERKGIRDNRTWVLYLQVDPDSDDVEVRTMQARIVACVNACMGVPSKQMTPGLLAAALNAVGVDVLTH